MNPFDTNVNMGGMYDIISPYLFMAISAAVVGLLTWLTNLFKQWTGIQIEAKHREALHSAVMTGVSAQLARMRVKAADVNVDTKSILVKAGVDWALSSVPDALKYLGASPEALVEIANSKITLLAESAPNPASKPIGR